MFKRNLCAALVFGAAAAAPPMGLAQASVPCFERDQLIETLKSRYQEFQIGGGLQQSGNLLEIWSSADTGSFTVFITDTSGQSCVVSSGENWHWAIRSGGTGTTG